MNIPRINLIHNFCDTFAILFAKRHPADPLSGRSFANVHTENGPPRALDA